MSKLSGPLGFLYVASYCLLVLTTGWKGWLPGFLGCIVMASWPIVWTVGTTLLQILRQRWSRDRSPAERVAD